MELRANGAHPLNLIWSKLKLNFHHDKLKSVIALYPWLFLRFCFQFSFELMLCVIPTSPQWKQNSAFTWKTHKWFRPEIKTSTTSKSHNNMNGERRLSLMIGMSLWFDSIYCKGFLLSWAQFPLLHDVIGLRERRRSLFNIAGTFPIEKHVKKLKKKLLLRRRLSLSLFLHPFLVPVRDYFEIMWNIKPDTTSNIPCNHRPSLC